MHVSDSISQHQEPQTFDLSKVLKCKHRGEQHPREKWRNQTPTSELIPQRSLVTTNGTGELEPLEAEKIMIKHGQPLDYLGVPYLALFSIHGFIRPSAYQKTTKNASSYATLKRRDWNGHADQQRKKSAMEPM